jgi:hypothetical protein
MGKTEEAMEVLKDAARFNDKTLPANTDKLLKQVPTSLLEFVLLSCGHIATK